MILKKGMNGEIDLMGPAKAVSKEILSIPSYKNLSDKPFFRRKNGFKKLQKSYFIGCRFSN